MKMKGIFVAIFLIAILAQYNVSQDVTIQSVRQKIDQVRQMMNNYQRLFSLHNLAPLRWRTLQQNLSSLNEKIGTEIQPGNLNTALAELDRIRSRIQQMLDLQLHLYSFTFRFSLNHTGRTGTAQWDLFTLIQHIQRTTGERGGDIDGGTASPDCPADMDRFARAFRLEVEAGLYPEASEPFARRMAKAIRQYAMILSSNCLPRDHQHVRYARDFIQERKAEIERRLKQAGRSSDSTNGSAGHGRAIHPLEIAAFKTVDPQWAAGLPDGEQPPSASNPPEADDSSEPDTRDQPDLDAEKTEKPGREAVTTAPVPRTVTKRSGFKPLTHAFTLDVWQSAWGDFSGISELINYLRNNNIRRINLNPGLPMGPKFYAEGYRKMKPLVDRLYRGGIEKIAFLYAELNYSIEYFARFLHDHPDLKIDTIVDDSEFVDMFRDRFHRNVRAVKKWGIKYSAFVTLESVGNSGVSDATRFWVIDNVDYPILMSYFGCTLEQQKQILTKYLRYADDRGIRGRVGIAILLGSKKVGREVSCERLLGEKEVGRFLRSLHQWALESHPSYGGIVLETNLRMPRQDIR